MKKTLLAFSVLLTVVCCALAFASNSPLNPMRAAEANLTAASTEADNQGYGVSIGTVEAIPYSESGLDLDYFSYDNYVAKTSDGTYMGFEIQYDWMYDELTGEEKQIDYASFVAINSTEEAVTIPDSISVEGKKYPVLRINGYYNLRNGFNSNIKTLTIPSTVNYVYIDYNFDRYLDAMYMLGTAPEVSGRFQVSRIYVCDRTNLASYTSNDGFSNSTILPYGWDFEWITVNVEKNGEFAETYLTQNDYDWGAAQYVKVVGNINDIDLSAIKNLTTLMKLDLSETTITSLPADFMNGRNTLMEVKLPPTVKTLGDGAFRGCSALQSFDLNGITAIGANVFNGCTSLSYINLTGVKTIGTYAFDGCTKLNGIDLSTVAQIGPGAFRGCSALEMVDLTSVENLGAEDYWSSAGSVFENCTSLKSVTFGNKLQNIRYRTFTNTAIETIMVPEGVVNINNSAFERCPKLKSVELPSSLTTLSERAFYNCTSLTSVTMKTGLNSIGTYAFYGCTSLEDITIPATVKTISSGAFNNTAIKNFKCYAVVPPSATSSFIGGDMDMTRTFLYVPPFSKDFYRNTAYWSDFYLMRSIDEQIDYLLIDRPLTINLEEEDNAVVANNPQMDLVWNYGSDRYSNLTVGQLTATGEGTLSAGQLNVNAMMVTRQNVYYSYIPTLINYADKMRADNVSHTMTFNTSNERSVWHFLSLPYDVKVSDILPGNDTYWVIRRYDSAARAAGETSSTWVDLTSDDTMEAGNGYIVSVAGGETETDPWGNQNTFPKLTFTSGNSVTKNNIFRSTDVIVPLSEYAAEFAHNRSWNLIGNPYPCYFDMHFLNEEFTAPVTVYNGSSYVAYSPVDDDLVLSPYEAFFVQCPLNSTEMTFKAEGRMHFAEGKPAVNAPALNGPSLTAEERNVFNFTVTDGDNSDRARIVLNPVATATYEIGRDASKFFGDGDFAQLYVRSDVSYSIEERPVGDGVAILGIRSGKEATYTISLSGKYSSDWKVTLTDNVTGISTDLTKDDYEFVSESGDKAERFTVTFTLNGESGIEAITGAFGTDAEVTVTAINGMTVFSGKVSEITVPEAGLYIISDGEKVRKAILK